MFPADNYHKMYSPIVCAILHELGERLRAKSESQQFALQIRSEASCGDSVSTSHQSLRITLYKLGGSTARINSSKLTMVTGLPCCKEVVLFLSR